MAATLESPLVCPVLVGRDACIAAVDRTLDDVQAGRGRTLLISGEAGIGKSRLIAALRDRAAGAALFQGSCFERDHSLPYAPVVDALRTLCSGLEPVAALQRVGPDLAALLPELGITSGAPDDPEQAQQRVVQSLVQLLKSMAAQQPLLVVFEDLHWSDAASLTVFGVTRAAAARGRGAAGRYVPRRRGACECGELAGGAGAHPVIE